MPREDAATGLAREWLRHARSNLALARGANDPAILRDSLCFEAQQAGEKAVKAVLVFHRVDFPRTHRIAELLSLLEQAGHDAPDAVWQGEELSDFATVARYPDNPVAADEEQYRRAIAVAEAIVRWAAEMILG